MFFCCYLLPSFEFQPDYFEFCWALWSCLYYIIISYHHILSSSIFIIFFVPSIVMILSPQGDELHEPATECWRLVRRCFKYARMFPVQVAPAKGQGSWIDHRRNWNPLGSEFDPIYLMFVHVFFIFVPICSFVQIFDRTTKTVKPRGPYLSFDTEAAAALWHMAYLPICLAFALHFFLQLPHCTVHICFWCRIHSTEVLVDKPTCQT